MPNQPNEKDMLVYLGTIDDVVLRFPWSGIKIEKEFLMNTILDHVLFGNSLLINDGYLINHPLAREDLLKGKNSVILALVKSGFIKVLTRVADTSQLLQMPMQMAVNIESFQKVIGQDDWQRFKFVLQDLGESLRINHNCYRWPPIDMGDGFRILVENVLLSIEKKGMDSLGLNSVTHDEIRQCLENVANRLNQDTSGARNYFEQTVKQIVTGLNKEDGSVFVTEMMGLANEIYHFNFGINLDYHFRNQGLGVITETRFSRAFDDLLMIDEAYLEIENQVPLLHIPDFLTSLEPRVITEIVDASSEIGEAKQLFLTRMRKFSRGHYTVEEAKEFSRVYSTALTKHFAAAPIRPALQKTVDIGVIVTESLIGAAMPVPIGGLIGDIGMALLSSFVGAPYLQRASHRFRQKKLEKDLTKENLKTQRHKYVANAMIGSLRFDTNQIDPIAHKVKKL